MSFPAGWDRYCVSEGCEALSFPKSCDSHKQSYDPVHSGVTARPQVLQVI